MRTDIYKHYKKKSMKGDAKIIATHNEVIFEKDSNTVYDAAGNFIGTGVVLEDNTIEITAPKPKEAVADSVIIKEEPVPETEKDPIFGNLKKDNEKK